MYDQTGDDDLDEACKMHDLGYDTHGRDNLDVDRALVERLRALDPDPRNWSKPPETKEDIEYASAYRAWAIVLFHFKVRNAEIEEWRSGTSLGDPPLTI